jgi:hypothetical protein
MQSSAHFCPGCGIAVSAENAGAARPGRPRRAALVALIAGAALIIVAAVVALRRPQPSAQAAPPPPATTQPVHDAAAATAATPATTEFDWSGLSHEELVQARSALDAAIAREEQRSASGGTAAPAPAQ